MPQRVRKGGRGTGNLHWWILWNCSPYTRISMFKYLCLQFLCILVYLHFVFTSSDSWSEYLSRAMCTFVALSGASKAANTHVFFTELGFATLQIWKLILTDCPPLSPPIFIQTSFWGIVPLWFVSWLHLMLQVLYTIQWWAFIRIWAYREYCSKSSMIFPIKSGVYTIGAALSSSPPDFSGNEKGTASAARFSPTISRACFLCCLSLAKSIPQSFRNL